MLDKYGSKYSDYAPVLLRLALGLTFIVHGSRHLDVHHHAVGHHLVTAIELVGGVLVLIGLATREAAAVLGCLALWNFLSGHGLETLREPLDHFNLACLTVCGALILMGAGRLSIAHRRAH